MTHQAEKQSIRMQLDRTESELRLSQEQNTLLTGKLHKAEREISSLKSQVDYIVLKLQSDLTNQIHHPIVMLSVGVHLGQAEEMRHTHKLELSNVKLDCVRNKGEIERERDILHSQVEGKHPLPSLLL